MVVVVVVNSSTPHLTQRFPHSLARRATRVGVHVHGHGEHIGAEDGVCVGGRERDDDARPWSEFHD